MARRKRRTSPSSHPVGLITRRELIAGMGAGIALWGTGCQNRTADGGQDTGGTDSDSLTGTDAGDTYPWNTDGPGTETDSSGGSTDPSTDPVDSATVPDNPHLVQVFHGADRAAALAALFAATDLSFAAGRKVVIKPNFNSANLFPASTHDDTIVATVNALRNAGCGAITLAESSGPSGTDAVVAARGIFDLCTSLGIDFLSFDDLDPVGWETFSFDGMGWPGGLAIPRIMRSDHAVVLLPCLKTHVWGEITLSLKLAVGLTPRDRRWTDLHPGSGGDRSLIADINMGFSPDLIVLDGMSAFRSGGPDTGDLCHPGLIIAGRDRVAVDAVGTASLKLNDAASLQGRPIFSLDQIARAAALGLGVASPAQIELAGNDEDMLQQIRGMLDQG